MQDMHKKMPKIIKICAKIFHKASTLLELITFTFRNMLSQSTPSLTAKKK